MEITLFLQQKERSIPAPSYPRKQVSSVLLKVLRILDDPAGCFRPRLHGNDRKSRWSDNDSLATKGFTLIEVVVALAILSIGLTVILENFSGGLRLAKASEEYTKAMNFAKVKMEEITSQQKVEEGTDEGKCDDERFRWQVKINKKTDMLPVEKDVDFTAPVELFQIKVDVFWKSGAQERSAGLETYQAIKLETDQGKT